MKLPKVDVFIMTRNSGRYLERCLRSVKKNVNINRLIIIDGGSTDNTLDIAKRYDVKVFKDEGRGLGYARKLAVNLCETNWICFIDADVELSDDWHKKIMKYVTSDIGALGSIALTIPINEYERRITRIQNCRAWRRAGDLKGRTARGFTGATLIRKSLLQDLRMPFIRSEEDYVITQHVLCRARWFRTPVRVFHYDRFSERPDRTIHTWATARFLKRMSTLRFLLTRVIATIKSLFIAIKYREILYFLYFIKYAIRSSMGWFHWKEYINKLYPVGGK